MNGVSWGVWWGLGLQQPAPLTLPAHAAQSGAKLARVRVSKRDKKTLRPELALSAGPLTLAQPGAGEFADLYSSRWALGLYDTGPQLFQAQSGVWVDREGGNALADLDGAAHVSLAFDQAARPVLAWADAGGVYIRQWQAGADYVTRGPFPGCDPVLISDAVAHYAPAQSDLMLIHLDPARAGVVSRLQRDFYAVARPVVDVPAGSVLDQVTALPYRVQVIGQSAAGEDWAAMLGLYPVSGRDAATGAASGPLGGAVVNVLISQALDTGATGAASGPLGGAVVSTLISQALDTGATGAASGPLGGDYGGFILSRTEAHSPTGTASGPLGGVLFTVVLIQPVSTQFLTGAATGPQGGNYA